MMKMKTVMCCVMNIPKWSKKFVSIGLYAIPDVLLNLCLGFQIKRISCQKSYPLLLSLGSILLLLQQHFGETLCGKTDSYTNMTDSYQINSKTF